MKRLELIKRGTLEWRETAEPSLARENQAIVQPVAVARCDLDLPIVQGKSLFRPPFALGHEFVARISSLSSDLSHRFTAGQLVAVSFQVSCGSCSYCSAGLSKSCEEVIPTAGYGMPPGAAEFGGALAERVLVPYAKQMLLPLPESIDPVSVASLSDNIAEADKLVGRFLPRVKDGQVLVLGGTAASIGLYSALYAKSSETVAVTYMDSDPERLELASGLGIECLETRDFKKSPGRFDLVCDASANEESWKMGLKSLKPAGIFASASIFWSNKVPIPYLDLYNQEAEIHIGRVNSIESMKRILPSIVSGKFDPGKIVTRTAPFQEALEAWQEEAIKLVIKND
ncbi:MAG: alcohol dehydrogenase catalytic domain-containing protein [Leptospiraceae bacterium]|nr:alcohol dehydrogenase catalytic domain-containing protein [Leptospiraceae bacterium]